MRLRTTSLSVTKKGRPRYVQRASSGGGGGGGGGSTTWNDISTATFVQDNVMQQNGTTPNGIFFKPDGTKIYTVYGAGSPYLVYTMTLTTPWDISTWQASHTFTGHTNGPAVMDIFFKPDGTKFFYADWQNDRVLQYSLSTAWDLSSASYLSYYQISGESMLRGLYFSPDGTKMFVNGFGSDKIRRFTLSTAWDVTSASVHSTSLAIGTVPLSLTFKPDGTRCYTTDNGDDRIRQWNLDPAWDISSLTATNYDDDLQVGSRDGTPAGMFIPDDGSRMYFGGAQYDRIYQHSL